jgi:hypothetical protein
VSIFVTQPLRLIIVEDTKGGKVHQ